MNVTCPDCGSVFRVDPAKVPAAGVRARCSVCGGVIAVAHEAALAPAAAAPSAVEIPRADAPPEPASAGATADFESTRGVAAPPPEPRVATPSAPKPAGLELVVAQRAPEPAAEPPAHPRPARPFNPYLSNTPELRARRLARALVSDLVAYNPQKREEGLRDGTLRQLFRDEIRKSWDEYVEQVGAQVAESTPHFQDALNDVLAGGRRVF